MPFASLSSPRCARRLVGLAAAVAVFPMSAAGQTPTPLTTVRVASGILQPVWVGGAPGDFGRLFIVQQGTNGFGQIRLLDLTTGVLQPTPFLTIGGMNTQGERGLLSMVFHPEFATNGYFWVYGNFGEDVRLVRYRAQGTPLSATAADPDSAYTLLSVSGHTGVHHSGWMEFGLDGHLWLAIGEAGVPSNARDITDNLSGKIIRIDVDGPDNIPGNADDDGFPDDPSRNYHIPADNPFVGIEGDDEIWAYGLRNAWRNDLDPLTGELFISDVGEGTWEEIQYQPGHIPGTLPGDPNYYGGRDYGWNCYEGHFATGQCAELPSGTTFPFLVYGHLEAVPPTNATGCAVTGGVVYRGCAIPDLDGTYFFADFCSHRIFSLRQSAGVITEFAERTAELVPPSPLNIRFVSSFGRDAWGEIYICDLVGGEVFKIVPAVPYDINGDGIADACRCPADWNGDGVTNSNDISAFISSWLSAVTGGLPGADYNGDGVTNSNDISAFITSWLAALSGGC